MKVFTPIFFFLVMCFLSGNLEAQDQPVYPSLIRQGTFLGITPPLSTLPPISEEELRLMQERARDEDRNPELRERSYPFAATALPKGPDPVWQKTMGHTANGRAPIMNFQAQTSPSFPPDANGVVGPNHYMQTINTTYAIYNKSGTLLAGPTALNTLFSGVPGSNYNDGDPIILYDEQADRWLVAEFSYSGSNDYEMIAVSTTNNPTGTWYKYSFDVTDMPDYPKLGIWQDGYYMGTNTTPGNDIYVFERSVMLAGGANPTMVGFDNAWRPTTSDGFMCVPPLDNDGTFAPAGSPGLFITINDDAIGGGSDQLWIYELEVNWNTPDSSTFSRVQQIDVAPFDSNFGTSWDNVAQLGVTRKLDAIPQVIMNPPQYRNFGSYETIVCCHTVDVDNTDHAGIRWYELRRTSGNWSIRQQGTFAPDGYSRWMGSIVLNGSHELAIGYSISNSTIYPGIRYCGQSAASYATGNSLLDIAEETIQDGIGSQSVTNRWGDYSAISIDPTNDSVFWFTTEYIGSSQERFTRIASFNIPVAPGYWTGVASGDWSNPANWLDGSVPGGSIDITIADTAQNWPVFTGDLSLGTNCGNINLEGAAQLTVTGNLTIGPGKRIGVEGTGIIRIGGNWSNQGTFNYGTGTVEFNGSSPATITGKSPTSMAVIEYSRSTFSPGMTALSNPSAGPSGDDAASDVAIPFTFYYGGVGYSSAHICTNGWISLNGSGAAAYDNIVLFTSTTPNTTIAPWFDDLDANNQSDVNYATTGTEPNRVFSVEWLNIDSWAGTGGVRINFQLKLYETSNIIEFYYGTVGSGVHTTAEGASIGIEDATGGDYHFVEGTTGCIAGGVVNLSSLDAWPASNIRFTPPSFTESFYNISVSKTAASVQVNNNLNVLGNVTVNPGSTIDIPGNLIINVQGTGN